MGRVGGKDGRKRERWERETAFGRKRDTVGEKIEDRGRKRDS